jgi:hypothetical protein
MIVENVECVTVTLENGKHIDFTKDEFTVQAITTRIKNSDGTQETKVQYYQITTTPIEVG